jgi:ATP-dependent helicase/nuclease subunit A
MRREAENEYRRLLYVGMTRAIERLVVCGFESERKRPEGCWYDLVHDGLVPFSVQEDAEDGDGKLWRYRKPGAPEDARLLAAAAPATPAAGPPWLLRDAPAEQTPLTPLSPSSAYDEKVMTRTASGTDRRKALARGEAMHRLLQSLPDLPPALRADAARRHLGRLKEFDEGERENMLGQVLALLDDGRFADLFKPGSRAEVPIVGRLDRPGLPPFAISGQVDRLVVTDDAVLIADYKTNRPAPATPPHAYVSQLALYRAVLAQLYPDKTIRAVLIWTDLPDLIEIPAADLDAALVRVMAP